jgi:hypothetical protein
MKSKTLAILVGTVLLVSNASFTALASQDLTISFSGGPVSGSMTLKDKGSPYQITSPIDVPEGSSLTINPGVELISQAPTLFRVQGALVVTGSAQQPVVLKASKGFIETIKTSRGQGAERVDISFAHITGGPDFDIDAVYFNLTDSEIVNQSKCGFSPMNTIKISDPNSSFARNFFKSTCGFQFDVVFNIGGPRGTFLVENNHFSGNSKSGSWLTASALFDDTLTLIGNTFSSLSTKAITTGFFEAKVFADGNFWGNLSLAKARQFSESSTPDTFKPALVVLDQILEAPSALAPKAQRYNLQATPAPKAATIVKAVKYKNCSALNKVYSGGVSKSSTSTNKGSKTKQRPTVNASVYNLNKSLDRDKDGISCER